VKGENISVTFRLLFSLRSVRSTQSIAELDLRHRRGGGGREDEGMEWKAGYKEGSDSLRTHYHLVIAYFVPVHQLAGQPTFLSVTVNEARGYFATPAR
jgi:hypothetical protein